jgi:hypothetical protein
MPMMTHAVTPVEFVVIPETTYAVVNRQRCGALTASAAPCRRPRNRPSPDIPSDAGSMRREIKAFYEVAGFPPSRNERMGQFPHVPFGEDGRFRGQETSRINP